MRRKGRGSALPTVVHIGIDSALRRGTDAFSACLHNLSTESFMSRLAPVCSLLVVVAASSLGAAELSFLDLRVGGGILSNEMKGSSSTTVTNNSTNVTTDSSSGNDRRNADNNYRGQLQLVYGNLGPAGGLIIGGGIAANQARFENGSTRTDVTTPVVDVLIGYGIAVTPSWHFELTPFAGAGRAYTSTQTGGNNSTSKDWSKYVEYGASIGTYYTFGGSLQVGLEVPYLVGRYNPQYTHDDGQNTYSVDDTNRNEGFGLLLTVGARF